MSSYEVKGPRVAFRSYFVVPPRLIVHDGSFVVASVRVEAGEFVANHLSHGEEAGALLPARETLLLDRGEELPEEVVSLQDVAASVALEVDDELGLARRGSHLQEGPEDALELGRGGGIPTRKPGLRRTATSSRPSPSR